MINLNSSNRFCLVIFYLLIQDNYLELEIKAGENRMKIYH